MTDSIYITTAIPYVNARPHVGFALELVQADALARYHRLLGRHVTFQTGTDENAQKNVLAARQQGLGVRDFVERNSEVFRQLTQALSISADRFVRTTEPRHRCGVETFWRSLRPGDLYRKPYRGLYCVGCEDFLTEKDLVDGRCTDHDRPLVEVAEENWFFRLSAYQRLIEELLESGRLQVTPGKRANEVLAFVRGGLQDISISRDAARSEGWGIPVPGDPSQVVYVWIDALINYVSGPGYGSDESWQQTWNGSVRKMHVIGKNVWKFHAVYWPALLLSAGLTLPDVVQVHGFLTEGGRKISKSLGATVDPFDAISRTGPDGLRYALLRAVAPGEDGDFSLERLVELHNADLANGLGNLVSRLRTLCDRAGLVRFPSPASPPAPGYYHEAFAAGDYRAALDALWGPLAEVDRQIEQARPWAAIKAGRPEEVHPALTAWLAELHRVAWWLQPLLPATAGRILEALAADPIVPGAPLLPRAT